MPALKRKDSFFGVHFDFHAKDDETPVGRNTTPEAIRAIVETVQPDFIQFDCKGHPGLSSYPTRVGYPAPKIMGDPLRIVREVTLEYGVALFVHYSGLWDTYAIKMHPEWARIDEEGVRDANITSAFSGYADELMIPQLKELAGEYGVDGAWVDGDCWVAALDYSAGALEAFREETGIESVPRGPDDEYYDEFREFTREVFRRYVRHYVDEIHSFAPSFQITSNWAFTEFMPEPVTASLDFLSGDAFCKQGVFPRNECRCMAGQGVPWDVMSWHTAGDWPDPGTNTTKSAAQLSREAATAMAFGGGYQAVFNQKSDGTVISWNLAVMGEVGRFCRERQPYTRGARLVPEIAVLYSRTDLYFKTRELPWLYNPGPALGSVRGTLDVLLDAQLVVEVLMEHQVPERLDQYSFVVLPNCGSLEPGLRERLLSYVEGGGGLLCLGLASVRMYQAELGVTLGDDSPENSVFFLEHGGRLSGHRGTRASLKGLGRRPVIIGAIYPDNDMGSSSEPAGVVAEYGQGRIAGVPFDLGGQYYNILSAIDRNYIAALASVLSPDPAVSVSGSTYVEVALSQRDNELLVNLTNTSGRDTQKAVWVLDELPPLSPVHVSLKVPSTPKSVTCQPGTIPLDFRYERGRVEFTVSGIDINAIAVVRL